MPSGGPQSLIIKSDIGIVGNFDPTVLARIPVKDSLYVGQVFLRATLDEMIKIRNLSKILAEDNRKLLQETGDKYLDLEQDMKELRSLERRKWLFKLLHQGKLNRARRTFVFDTFELYDSTSTKSDSMKKDYMKTPTADLAVVESGSVPKNQRLDGLVLDLPSGPMTQEAVAVAQEIMATLASGNPFADPTPDIDNQVGQTPTTSAVTEAGMSSSTQSNESPSGRSSASSFNYFGSMNLNVTVVSNTNSTASGIAINNASGNGGSAPDRQSSIDNPP